MITIVLNIVIASCAIIAGWWKCVEEHDNVASIIHRLPLIGSKLSRIRPLGWVLIVILLVATIANIWLAERQQDKIDQQLVNLGIANKTLQDQGFQNEQAISLSLQRLRQIDHTLELVDKQTAILGDSSRENLALTREANIALSSGVANLQRKLVDVAKEHQMSLQETSKQLTDSLGLVAKSINEESEISKQRAQDSVALLEKTANRINNLTLLLGTISIDEVEASLRLMTIDILQQKLLRENINYETAVAKARDHTQLVSCTNDFVATLKPIVDAINQIGTHKVREYNNWIRKNYDISENDKLDSCKSMIDVRRRLLLADVKGVCESLAFETHTQRYIKYMQTVSPTRQPTTLPKIVSDRAVNQELLRIGEDLRRDWENVNSEKPTPK